MCPLRVLLIFLSATLAGFFVIRNLKTQPQLNEEQQEEDSSPAQLPLSTKSCDGNGVGFWDESASGRYLWRILKRIFAVGRGSCCFFFLCSLCKQKENIIVYTKKQCYKL
ncbi:hypothetical protein B296_00009463 [Ensete ventricosum]|uniref:Secreted protein n=1 Tax=Ensete ventricosum TaxID=4639 RepID=A0A427BAE3_ENSVE|nr:hypothetical protein B296_00009463 [Ensete ventricosum]